MPQLPSLMATERVLEAERQQMIAELPPLYVQPNSPIAGTIKVSGPRDSSITYDKDLRALHVGYPQRYVMGAEIPEPPERRRRVAEPYSKVGSDTEVLMYESGYMRGAHDPDRAWEIFSALAPELPEFDTLVGTGLSAALVLPTLAHRADKHFAIVRKPEDSTHSCHALEGQLGKRWIFVDDLMESGATFVRVWDAIEGVRINRGFDTKFQGGLLYYRRRAVRTTDTRWDAHIKQFSKYHNSEGELPW